MPAVEELPSGQRTGHGRGPQPYRRHTRRVRKIDFAQIDGLSVRADHDSDPYHLDRNGDGKRCERRDLSKSSELTGGLLPACVRRNQRDATKTDGPRACPCAYARIGVVGQSLARSSTEHRRSGWSMKPV